MSKKMRSIMLIDDNPGDAMLRAIKGIPNALLVRTRGSNREDLLDSAVAEFDLGTKVDILLLDIIMLHSDEYGGLWIYDSLVTRGYKAHWTDTIIISLAASAPIVGARSIYRDGSFEKHLGDWAMARGIPAESLISKYTGGWDTLIERIKVVLGD